MKNLITIVQPEDKGDGQIKVANGTRFLFADGTELDQVVSCTVRFAFNEIVMAVFDVAIDQVQDIEAHPLLSMESLKAAAEHYGFDLVKKEPGAI